MLDILLSDPFMYGVVGTVLVLLLALIMILPSTTSSPEPPPQQWRVIEPVEQLPTVVAKRIEVKR